MNIVRVLEMGSGGRMANPLSYELKCCARTVALLCSAILLATASAAQNNIGTLSAPEPTDTQSAATSGSNEALMFAPSQRGGTAVPVYLGKAKPARTSNRAPIDERQYPSPEYWTALADLVRAHETELNPDQLKAYPNRQAQCSFVDGETLAAMIEKYVDDILVALPVRCILPHRIDELAALSATGNQSSRIALLSLGLEFGKRDNVEALNLLLKISDSGSGAASIAAGSYFESRGDGARAIERYELAGRQGIPNYHFYIRAVGTVPPMLAK